MAQKRKREYDAERLAKGARKAKAAARAHAEGKSAARSRPRRDAAGAPGDARQSSPLARLIQSLGEEKIRLQVVGMTAAILQGVMMNTLDTDIWVDLPTRQYMRLWNIVRRLGGTALSQTLYVLEDGKVVNFVFSVDGLRSFAAEYRNALTFRIDGLAVKVLPLERVLKAKRATGGERK